MPLQINVAGDDTRPRYRRKKGSAAHPPEPWACECRGPCPDPGVEGYCAHVQCRGDCPRVNPRYLACCPDCGTRRP